MVVIRRHLFGAFLFTALQFKLHTRVILNQTTNTIKGRDIPPAHLYPIYSPPARNLILKSMTTTGNSLLKPSIDPLLILRSKEGGKVLSCQMVTFITGAER
jgi:hypothetical protein